jgi:yjeF C-terminal region, hydroxyethylthiazole kinase-related
MEELIQKLERDRRSHKGDNGRVAVIAGSKDFSGAPALVAKAALRTGADLVKIMTSERVSSTVASYSENFVIETYSDSYFTEQDVEKAQEIAEWSDVTVIGSGLSDPSSEALKQLFQESSADFVLDADAIPSGVRDAVQAVYTPHQGETMIMKQEFGSVERFADETGSTVAVTGPSDSVIGKENYRSERGTAAMTVGGTGDVLAGVIGSLRAQGLNGFEAAKLGLWLNGRAGEMAAEQQGHGLLATDIVECLPDALY